MWIERLAAAAVSWAAAAAVCRENAQDGRCDWIQLRCLKEPEFHRNEAPPSGPWPCGSISLFFFLQSWGFVQHQNKQRDHLNDRSLTPWVYILLSDISLCLMVNLKELRNL